MPKPKSAGKYLHRSMLSPHGYYLTSPHGYHLTSPHGYYLYPLLESILVILYDFLILYIIRMKKFLRSTDDVVSAAITLCSQSNTKAGKDGHFTLSVLKRAPSLIPRCNCRQERRRGPTLHMYKYTEKLQKTCNSKLVKTKLKDSINTQRQHRFQITLYL
jgi:hypothetical protein